ncbi:MAG: hypothetical protein JO246_06070 [Frankiaceae bacterium]|nr:hypothetical protein [Frankiaceae bacterium]MBV9869556.1 hypothetical protein [Frankiaceae bacterium]
MRRLFDRPGVTYTTLVVAMVILFGLSAVGNSGSDAQNAKSSVGWIGAIGWFGFLLTILATVAFSLALVVRRIRRRDTSSA